MRSIPTLTLTLLAAAGFTLIGAAMIRAADATFGADVDAATKAKILGFDKGPAVIDVAAYPAGIRKGYAIFREKCTLCHTLARPINSDFALPDEWSRYVKRMMYKPGSMISPANGKKIYEFLVYDSSVRKKALLDDKLANAAPAERADAEKKIEEIAQANAEK
jgi:cytochrome c5